MQRGVYASRKVADSLGAEGWHFLRADGCARSCAFYCTVPCALPLSLGASAVSVSHSTLFSA
jgi:hypothetical protein